VRNKAALAFGSLVHMALAAWYVPGTTRGEHPGEAFVRFFEENPIEQDIWDEDENRHDALELGVAMLNGYVAKYGKEPHIQILQPEQSIQIDVYDKLGNYLCTWVGTVDATFYNKKIRRTGAFEHKTAKVVKTVTINSGYGDQGLAYWWALCLHLRDIGVLKKHEVLGSVWYNFLRKALPDSRPQNAAGHYLNKPTKDALLERCAELQLIVPSRPKVDDLVNALVEYGDDPALLGEPSSRQPKPLFDRQELVLTEGELLSLNKRIRSEAWEMAQVRAGKLPIYKNPSLNCDWDCQFKDPCEVHEVGGDAEGILELSYKVWDPYEAHQLLNEKDSVS
jgi:hypothetical protein